MCFHQSHYTNFKPFIPKWFVGWTSLFPNLVSWRFNAIQTKGDDPLDVFLKQHALGCSRVSITLTLPPLKLSYQEKKQHKVLKGFATKAKYNGYYGLSALIINDKGLALPTKALMTI
ncbi:MAG: hypothetical protein IPO48_17065 [Saprospiraceae bacterium]|nr:hypothetical protein [Saprospiraceae bacterium]